MKLNDASINFSQTTVAIVYMQNLANDDLVTEVKRRLNTIKTDALMPHGRKNRNKDYAKVKFKPEVEVNILYSGVLK
ncbi:hypothetical protein CN450_06745 [Bacillus cereus]|nr:hypothetical protein CN450_06745 [Bacillus cereus]